MDRCVIVLLIVIIFFILLIVINRNEVSTILFIGDSFTFKNDTPGILQKLLGNKKFKISMDVWPSRTLTKAWESQNLLDRIKKNKYTYVVLQDMSNQPVIAFSDFMTAMNNFITLIKSVGSKIVLYETWTYKDGSPVFSNGSKSFCTELQTNSQGSTASSQDNKKVYNFICDTDNTTTSQKVQSQIRQAYQLVSKKYNLPIVYVGDAFFSTGNNRDTLLMNTCDDLHPNLAGSYLIALMFYQFFTGKSAKTLSIPSDGYTGCEDCLSSSKCKDCCADVRKEICKTCTKVSTSIDSNTIEYLECIADNMMNSQKNTCIYSP
jgi:hypothetical protein